MVVDFLLLFVFQIREQNRQDMKTAGPRSQVLASVITDNSPPVRSQCNKIITLIHITQLKHVARPHILSI